MIDEVLQERAILYILGELPTQEVGDFEAELDRNEELEVWMREISETYGLLAGEVPQAQPPQALRAKILSIAITPSLPNNSASTLARRTESHLRSNSSRSAWAPWWQILSNSNIFWIRGLAFLLLIATIATIALAVENSRISNKVEQLAGDLRGLKDENQALHKEIEARVKQIAMLQKQNTLDELEIATLHSKTPALRNVKLVVIWNSKTQQGLIDVDGLPGAGAGKDYQLWILDPAYASPVSAGILAPKKSEKEKEINPFSPLQPVHSPGKFAISLEKTGGSPAPAGPILFIGS